MQVFTFTLFLCFASSIDSAPYCTSENQNLCCLRQFYDAAYVSKFDCTKSYAFFSNDLAAQHTAFKVGKDCFLQVISAECTPKQFDLISTEYDDFFTTLTTKPLNDSNCTSDYYEYNFLKCVPMNLQVSRNVLKFLQDNVDQNDPSLMKFLDLCDDTAKCFANVQHGCNTMDKAAEMISLRDFIEIKNSAFLACALKIEKERPDMSGYKCLGGTNYYALGDFIKLMSTKKLCTKKIYESICGNATGYNFDKFAEYSFKNAQAKKNSQAKQFPQQWPTGQ